MSIVSDERVEELLENEQRYARELFDARAALCACVKAMRDVQDYWSDPNSYSHNRLETPLLVHSVPIEDAFHMMKRARGFEAAAAAVKLGYPAEWDACAPTATPSSHNSRRSSSGRCR